MQYTPYTFANSKTTYFKWAPVMSYNPNIVATLGVRRFGKTYGLKKIVTKDFFYKNAKFIWLRDNDDSVDKLLKDDGEKFFTDYKKEFKYFEGRTSGNKLIINDKNAGEVMNFMTFYKSKGAAFDTSYKNLILDEAIPERGQARRQFRARSFLNMLYSITDTRTDVRIWLTSNALDRGDEILRLLLGDTIKDFGIYRAYHGKNSRVALHYYDVSPAFIKKQEESVVGGLIKGSPWAADMLNGQFNSSTDLLFDKRPPRCRLVCIIHTAYNSARCWLGADGVLYVTNDDNLDTRPDIRYAVDPMAVSLTVHFCPPNVLEALRESFSTNRVRFEDVYIKDIFINFITKKA